MKTRERPEKALDSSEIVSPPDLSLLLSISDYNHWSKPPDHLKEIIVNFKNKAKNYYYRHQGRACCYCSIELSSSQKTFDAEHILDKKTFPQFMFLGENLAVSCAPCNQRKSAKNILSPSYIPSNKFPKSTNDFIIVHPHFDEWSDHFYFGLLGTIKYKSPKGKSTIDICGILTLNAARLSDAFAQKNRNDAERLLIKVFSTSKESLKQKHIKLLESLSKDNPIAETICLSLKSSI